MLSTVRLPYIVGATYKAKQVASAIDEEGTIDLDELH